MWVGGAQPAASSSEVTNNKMAVEIQVLKIDYPEMDEASILTCKLKSRETGATVYDSATIGRGEQPTFKFEATVSPKSTIEFQIASRDNSSPCSCVAPLNFVLALKKEDQINMFDKIICVVHLTRRTAARAKTQTRIQEVAARVWFGPNTIHQQQSRLRIPQTLSTGLSSDLKQYFSKESQNSCSYWYAVRSHPTVHVLFHSTSIAEKLSSYKIMPVAYVNTSPVQNNTSILDMNGGKAILVPIVKPIALKCLQNSDHLHLHLIQESKPTPQFSASIPLDSLKPFQPYNMKFDQQWRKPSNQAEPADQLSGSNNCVFVSVLYFPPSSTYSEYEGLEVLVETPLLETAIKDDLIVCFQIKKVATETSASSNATDTRRNPVEHVSHFTALMQSCEDGRFISSPAYFFAPSEPKLLNNCKLSLKVYSVKHNSQSWWTSPSHSSVEFTLTKEIIEDLFALKNRQGLKYQFKREMRHSSSAAPIFQQLDVIVRWKNSSMRFLSEQFNLPKQQPVAARNDNLLNALSHDVERLRQENKILKKENGDFESFIMGLEASTVATATKRSDLKHLTKYDLIDKVVKLSEHLLKETEIRKRLETEVKKLQESLKKMHSLKTEFIELQSAHLSQQRLVKELQDKVVKYKQYVHICKQQDVTITKLESTLCEQSKDNKVKLAETKLKMENAYLRSLLPMQSSTHSSSLVADKEKTIVALQNEVSSLSKKLMRLQIANQHDLPLLGTSLVEATHRIEREEELRDRLALAEYREKIAIKELLAHQSQKNPKRKWLPSQNPLVAQSLGSRRKRDKESQLERPSGQHHSPDLSYSSGISDLAQESLPPLKHTSSSARTSFPV